MAWVLVTIAICFTALEIARIKYGEPRRQDALELKLDELNEKYKNSSSDKLDSINRDIVDLKVKVGFR